MAEDTKVLTELNDAALSELVGQIKEEEFQNVDLSQIDLEYQELAGLSPEELQSFLEEKVGVSAEEGVQGTIGSLIVTPATHC
jgi:hypothetical protein